MAKYPFSFDEFLRDLAVAVQNQRGILAPIDPSRALDIDRVEIPAGAVNFPIKIEAPFFTLATNVKCLRWSFECGDDRASKTRLRYVAMIAGRDMQTIYIDNVDQAVQWLEIGRSKSALDYGEIFPKTVLPESCPLIWIGDDTVPELDNDTPPVGGFGNVPDYVFRHFAIQAPAYDADTTRGNTANVYIVANGGAIPPGDGWQLQPGDSISLMFTSPRQLGAYSMVADQEIHFVGLYGALNPHRDDSEHTTVPTFTYDEPV